MISIVIVDDHSMFREGVRALLEATGEFRIAGETGDGQSVVPLVKRETPDVVLLDLQLPGVHGLEVIRQLRSATPATAVVVLSMHSSEAYVLEAVRSGACGYVLKDVAGQDLVQALREAVAGRRYLSPPLSEVVVEAYAKRSAAGEVDAYETLSPREREILRLTVQGLKNSKIAEVLDISARTVEAHRARIMAKLSQKTQTDLVLYAVRRGIVNLDR